MNDLHTVATTFGLIAPDDNGTFRQPKRAASAARPHRNPSRIVRIAARLRHSPDTPKPLDPPSVFSTTDLNIALTTKDHT